MSQKGWAAKHVAQGIWTTALLAGGIGIFLCYALVDTFIDGLIPRQQIFNTPLLPQKDSR